MIDDIRLMIEHLLTSHFKNADYVQGQSARRRRRQCVTYEKAEHT